MTDQLTKQTKVDAQIIVDFSSWKYNMTDCTVYTNPSNEDEMIVLFQDNTDPTKKVQITLKRALAAQ